jgi:hypothetical protein
MSEAKEETISTENVASPENVSSTNNIPTQALLTTDAPSDIDLKDEEYFPEWKQLVANAIDWEFGSIHLHQEISEIIKVKQNTEKYYDIVDRAKHELMLRGKRIINSYGKGYYVLKPDEYTTTEVEDYAAVLARKRYDLVRGIHAPTHKMTLNDRKTHEQLQNIKSSSFKNDANKFIEAAELAGAVPRQKMLKSVASKKGADRM